MFTNYVSEPFYDELLDESGEPRLAGESLLEHLCELNVSQLKALQSNADQTVIPPPNKRG